MRGLPVGWAAQIPHSWVWLNGKAEREIEVLVWPIADVNAYKFGKTKEGRFPGMAPLRVAGFIGRSYTKEMDISQTVPGSRFYPVGGTFYRVNVRKRSTISIEVGSQQPESVIAVYGTVSPARADQQIMVDVLFPDGTTHRGVEARTASTGKFDSKVSLLDANKKLIPGTYRVQAMIFNASDLADAESNVVYLKR